MAVGKWVREEAEAEDHKVCAHHGVAFAERKRRCAAHRKSPFVGRWAKPMRCYFRSRTTEIQPRRDDIPFHLPLPQPPLGLSGPLARVPDPS